MITNFQSKNTAERYSEGVLAEELSLKPIILNFIKNNSLKNKNVLDLGCGNGDYSFIFAKRGAKVIGLDKSKHQISLAKKMNSHSKIEYLVGNAKDLNMIGEKSIDLVFMNMLLPNLKNKQDLRILMREVKRILRKKGIFVITSIHPHYFSQSKDRLDKPFGLKKGFRLKDGLRFSGEAITNKGNKIVFNDTYFSPTFISKILSENELIIKNIVESRPIPQRGIDLPKYLLISGQKE